MESDTILGIIFWALIIFFSWSYIKKLLSTDDLTPKVKYGCPQCRSEYQPHVKVCSDCNLNLEKFSYFEFDN